MFLDAAIQIAGDRGVLAEGQAKEIEILAFDWIINGEKHVDSRFPDLIPLRDRVGGWWGYGAAGGLRRGRGARDGGHPPRLAVQESRALTTPPPSAHPKPGHDQGG